VLGDLALRSAEQYQKADPYSYIVIDDFEIAQQALDAMPAKTDPVWKTTSNQHTWNKSVLKVGGGLKDQIFDEPMRNVFYELTRASFLRFLETLTGIKGLIPDPYYTEGGYHSVGHGGFLSIHADFSHHPLLGLERRVNLLLYLNKDWKEEYGGHLHLCEGKEAKQKILPIFGRCVIFNTSDTSFHGHPVGMRRLPDGVERKSLALYYYSLPTGREKKGIVFA
jgi:Rps23 Pro-64 3,4-dihydroxylase Tpa1-like proline 4-hydroxylase